MRFEPDLKHSRLFELIGDASYSIYLIHIYAVAVVADIAFKFLDPANLWAYVTVSLAAIVIGTWAGILVYRWIEQPALRFFNRLFGKPRRQLAPAA